MASATQACLLMGLPGEIRTRIYRLALLGDAVQVTTASMTEPGLLTVCKDIRAEAGPIFYAENHFDTLLVNFDATPACFMCAKAQCVQREFSVTNVMGSVSAQPGPHWANLLQWLRCYHGMQVHFSYKKEVVKKMPAEEIPVGSIIYAMFRTANMLRGTAWEDVEGLMMEFRMALEAAEPAWAIDY